MASVKELRKKAQAAEKKAQAALKKAEAAEKKIADAEAKKAAAEAKKADAKAKKDAAGKGKKKAAKPSKNGAVSITAHGEAWIEQCAVALDSEDPKIVRDMFAALALTVEHVAAKLGVEFTRFECAHALDVSADILRSQEKAFGHWCGESDDKDGE